MSNNATTITPNVHIESIQTVMPARPTDRKSRRVCIPENLRSELFRLRFQIVLFYRKASDEDSGWVAAGWIKESLGMASLEQPMLSGRLRQPEGGGGPGELELVSNDSGIRFVEAQTFMSLTEFLDSRKKNDEVDVELVFWENINEERPHFSPLCYLQVTNFSCGGYSIGFSCSLLVMDPLSLTKFLKQWANIHKSIISKPDIPKLPIFYLPNLIKTGHSPTPDYSNSPKNKALTLIFNGESSENSSSNAILCIEESQRKFGRKIESNFTLIVKEISEETKAERVSREGVVVSSDVKGLVCESWDSLGADEIILVEGNKPVCVSCWVNSIGDEGVVMVIPLVEGGKSGKTFIVTIPDEK